MLKIVQSECLRLQLIKMILTILISTVLLILVNGLQASMSKPGGDQQYSAFDLTSGEKEPEVQYAEVKELNAADTRTSQKRLANVLQYEVTLDNEIFTVTLRPNKRLATPGCMIHSHLPGDEKDIYPCSRERLDCYYTGSSDVHNESWVAANICNGLKGVISFGNTSLFIEPVNATGPRETTSGNIHVVYRFHGNKQVCPVEGGDDTFGDRLHIVYAREKRAAQTRYIRTRLVVDPKMFYFHKVHDNIVSYTLMAFNIASKLFSDPSLGANIQLTLSEIHIIETYNDFGSELTENANRTLHTFCDWQSKLLTDADCSVLLTRLDLEADSGQRTINGLAHPKAMCNQKLNCAIVEDEGPIIGITIAHEIGHLLGLTHDTGTKRVGIMSAGGWSGKEAFIWSKQSSMELHSSLRSGVLSCINDRLESSSDESEFELPLPGTLYTADQQCKMRKNASYVFFQDSTLIPDPCRNIACRFKNDQPELYSSPLLDGTDCNNTRTWCIGGQCVAVDKEHASLSPVDGAWSGWDTEYSTCSRSCGGGVQIKRRYCNNPPPQYGGRHCPGISSLAKICNLQACGSDYRFHQCARMSPVTNGGRHVFVPVLGYYDDESCIMRCKNESSILEGKNYNDGTECLLNVTVPFSRCVHGRCMEFGCDGHSYSGLKYDSCGVCNGSGSTCLKISETFNKTDSPGVYTNVTVIPAGSSGINIRQENGYCFLSLLVNGKRILNRYMEKEASAVFNLNGIQFRYTSKPETIEISESISQDLVLQVFREWDFQKYEHVSPEISYTYYIPDPKVPQTYAWAEVPNQECSKSCGTGVSTKIVKCMSVTGQFVDDFHCDLKVKPKLLGTLCNTQPCPFSWKTSAWGNCSVPCGEGTKLRNVTCARHVNGKDQTVPSARCKDLTKPSTTSRCNNLCHWRVGNWSQCSRSCGEGYRVRNVSCFQSYGSDVDNKFCEQDNRPVDTTRCSHGPCYVLDGTCVDKRQDCKKYYDYTAKACDSSYRMWMMTNCLATCGVCANGSCVDEAVCQKVDPTANACYTHALWMKTHCPKTCSICQDCVDCSKHDPKFCKDSRYETYMRQNCAKYCKFC